MRKLATLTSVTVALFATLLPAPARADDADHEKAGPFTVGGKIGFGVAFGALEGATFVFSPEVGYALDKKNAYLIFDPQVQAGGAGGAFFTIPITFQYDIELPVKGLYLYPRASVGVSVFTEGGNPYFTGTPAVGIKYQVLPKLHVGGEPIRFPIHATDGGVFGQYQFLASVGADL